MLFKTLEFNNNIGQKVKITDIPVLMPGDTDHFMLSVRLGMFINFIYENKDGKSVYSFKRYLMSVLKWPVYEKIFKEEWRNNA
ncbi:DUF2535 family protein [Peribacillus cavernae]|uniref:DUF2535 family protein n=1 Tax=Peribacillus cavernae TaxID=1674310 RepID=A0A3S0VID0_9BACI|nr:DUF2535 family protein [Peribacillus cavernae]MDQ0217970.1 hypothetical protein [Peribacillus cavernae]RUQ32615.1 DUF2535 family protein [Peribacillus cavernae]